MTSRESDTFVLEVQPDNTLKATATSPAGTRTERGKIIDDPFLMEDIKDGIYELQEGQLQGRETAIRRVGRDLYRALFPEKIGEAFEEALRRILEAQANDQDRLLRVIIDVQQDSTVSTWPLEFLYCPSNKICLATEKPGFTLSRRIIFSGTVQPPQNFSRDSTSLRVLIVISKPKDEQGVLASKILEKIGELANREKGEDAKKIDVKVIGRLEAYESGIPGIDYLDQPASYGRIRELISGDSAGKGWRPHVLHFIGHGKAGQHEPCLGLVNEKTDTIDWTKATDIAVLFTTFKPRLVLLQACESGMSDTGFMSMALHLYQRNIPAVVAMQLKIDNSFATTFATAFYDALRDGKDVDEAVQYGRWKISNDSRWREPSFGAPVLFAVSPEGIIQPVSKRFPVASFTPQPVSSPASAIPKTMKAAGPLEDVDSALGWLGLDGNEIDFDLALRFVQKARSKMRSENKPVMKTIGDAERCLEESDSESARLLLQKLRRQLESPVAIGLEREIASPSARTDTKKVVPLTERLKPQIASLPSTIASQTSWKKEGTDEDDLAKQA